MKLKNLCLKTYLYFPPLYDALYEYFAMSSIYP